VNGCGFVHRMYESGCFAIVLALAGTVIDSASGGWPMYRGNPAQTGFTTNHVPERPVFLWTFKTGGAVRSSAVAQDGVVIVGSNDHSVYALSVRHGEKRWTFRTEGEVEAPPTIHGGRVYVGSTDGNLYALNFTDGTLVWAYETGDRILGAANVWGDHGEIRVLIGSYDYALHCLDGKTGIQLWQIETENYVNGSAAIVGSQAVFGACDGLIRVVEILTGEVMRKMDAGAYIAASIAVRNGIAYVGNFDNRFEAVSLRDGTIKWTYEDLEFPYVSSAAVTSGRVVFGGRDKRIHAVELETGKPVWVTPVRGRVDSSPVIANNRVIVGCDDGRIYMLDLDSGAILWTYEIGDRIAGSPAVCDGKILVGCEDGSIYAFGSFEPKLE